MIFKKPQRVTVEEVVREVRREFYERRPHLLPSPEDKRLIRAGQGMWISDPLLIKKTFKALAKARKRGLLIGDPSADEVADLILRMDKEAWED